MSKLNPSSPVSDGATFTPGPWSVENILNILQHGPDSWADHRDDEANARLIASAPELLEALEADPTILQEAADYLFNAGDGPMVDRLRLLQQIQEAAIKRARGQR